MKIPDNIYDDSWLYILLLTTLIILIESLKSYTIIVYDNTISYALLLFPVTYFLTNYICKKYGYKRAISAIAISSLLLIVFNFLMNFALGEQLNITNATSSFCGYAISQLINLTFYLFLLNNTRSPYIFVLLNYCFSILIYSMICVFINIDKIVLNEFLKDYFLTIGIQFIIVIPLSIIDKKILRGRDKKASI